MLVGMSTGEVSGMSTAATDRDGASFLQEDLDGICTFLTPLRLLDLTKLVPTEYRMAGYSAGYALSAAFYFIEPLQNFVLARYILIFRQEVFVLWKCPGPKIRLGLKPLGVAQTDEKGVAEARATVFVAPINRILKTARRIFRVGNKKGALESLQV